MEEQIADSMWLQHTTAVLMAAFAGIALLLGTIGVYGMMANIIVQRTHEIGVRMALGARPTYVVHAMLAYALRMTVGGILAGVAGALMLTRVLTSFLFGVTATNAATFVVVSTLLWVVAMSAAYIPARRATKVDPMVALRYE